MTNGLNARQELDLEKLMDDLNEARRRGLPESEIERRAARIHEYLLDEGIVIDE